MINDDNEQQLIRIAFNSLTEEFAVANGATDNDADFIPSILEICNADAGVYQFTTDVMERLGHRTPLPRSSRITRAPNPKPHRSQDSPIK